MVNDNLFSIFFKRVLIMILPIIMLISFATSLGLTFGNNPYFDSDNVLNTYFGFQSFFLMIDDIGTIVNTNVSNFLEHFKMLGNVITFNLDNLLRSIHSGDVFTSIINGFIMYFQLSFYPIIFIIVVLTCIMDLISIISNILSCLMSAFWGRYNMPYTEFYDNLPPLVSNTMLPMFL